MDALSPRTAQGSAAIPGQYIVGFRAGTTPEQQAEALRSIAPREVEQLGLINGALIVDPSRKFDPTAFDRSDVIEYVQPNMKQWLRDEAPTAISDDPKAATQYHLDNTGQTGGTANADVNAPEAWRQTTGKDVVVAIVDTRIDINHPDIKPNVWVNADEIAGNGVDDDANGYVDDVNGWNFANNNNDPASGTGTHGTHVAGIIGAAANNQVAGAGVAPNVKLMALPSLSFSNTTARAIKAWEYAVKNGANIISNSWGNNTYEPALAAAAKAATDAGALVVVAAGNENWDTGLNGSYPDNYAGSLAVAASDHNDKKASYSNRGTVTIDVAAPGDNIMSTLPNAGWGSMSGTSMAAPVVSGVAALVKGKYPNLSMKDVEQRILRSVQKGGNAAAWNDLVASGGRIDASAALTPLATVTNPAPVQSSVVGAPVPVGWNADVTDGQRFDVEVSRNPAASSVVDESFTAALTRKFSASGDAPWRVTESVGKDGTRGMSTVDLGLKKIARLDLSETLTEPTQLSFWYKTNGGGELSFFVDRDLQFQPASRGTDWKRFEATIPAGEHTFTWLGTGRTAAGQLVIDDLKIGKVSDAKWAAVGTTEPGQTKIGWTPDVAGPAAVRVRAKNEKFAGDWVTGGEFTVNAAQ
jgi:subtilisin family serine protease